MTFHFSLETLLRFRRHQEAREQRALRSIHSSLAALRHRLEQLRRDRDASRRLLNAQLQAGLPGARLRGHQATEELQSLSEKALEAEIEKFEQARRIQQKRHEQCWRACQTLESLRSRQFGEWRLQQERREQQRLDELAILRFRRAARSDPDA